MNKLYKCALGLLTTFILSFTCFSSAEYTFTVVEDYSDRVSIGTTYNNTEYDIICLKNINCNNSDIWFGYGEGGAVNVQSAMGNVSNDNMYCGFSDSIRYSTDRSCNFQIIGVKFNNYTSLQCQTEYNLIPISEVTPNYCALNFGMIDPQECPINNGTGAIVRSNLMINDVPYAQNQNINVFIPDFLSWNLSFNDLYTVIEVEGYDADEEYIENIINNEKLTPTNKDIEEMITGFMTNYFPYLALAIVFLYLARKIYKLFK